MEYVKKKKSSFKRIIKNMLVFFLVVVNIPHATKSQDGLRIYNRQHACLYCSNLNPKIGRHYLTSHKNESSVKAILELDAKTQMKQR